MWALILILLYYLIVLSLYFYYEYKIHFNFYGLLDDLEITNEDLYKDLQW